MYGGGVLDAIDSVDLDSVRAQHAPDGFTRRRASQPGRESDGPLIDPCPAWAFEQPARLVLVPCNRPVDAVTALGGVAGEADPPLVSAVLRC